MQRSEHPSGLFAGLAEIDPPVLWPGDGVGIALTVVAASRSPVIRSRLSRWRAVTFRYSQALDKRMAGSCQRRFPVVPRYRQRHGATFDLQVVLNTWSNQPSDFVRSDGGDRSSERHELPPCGETWIPLSGALAKGRDDCVSRASVTRNSSPSRIAPWMTPSPSRRQRASKS